MDNFIYAAHFVHEVLTGERATSKDPNIPGVQVIAATDCKSLFDCCLKHNLVVSEKRTLMSILALREGVPTTKQFADGLTTYCASLRKDYLQWLQKPYAQLHE